jgi:hypothetical protein
MYENDIKSTPEHATRAPGSPAARAPSRGPNAGDTAAQRTDPKFVRESNTMRRMHPWQIAALAVAAALVVALVLFYI